jgi:hypothetical protein
MILAAVDLWDILWSLFILFLIVQLAILVFMIVGDIIRSHDLSGAVKALWMIALLVAPLITMFVYLVARGDTVGERTMARHQPPTMPPPALA